MSKVGFFAVVVGASLAVACSGGPGSEEHTSQTQQAMCPINSDTCYGSGGLTRTKATATKPIGSCVDKPAGVSYAAFGNAVADPSKAGWAAHNVADPVWQFEDYIVRSGYVHANDTVYYIAPAGGTGFAWYGIQLADDPSGYPMASDKYTSESTDANITGYWSTTAPVYTHVVTCTSSYVDPGSGDMVSSTTYWSVHDPGACTSGGCGISHN
jgi:hypothetical protein